MYRYTLKCRECGTIIGYVSSPYRPTDGNFILNRVQCGDTIEPICCPTCEIKRLQDNKECAVKI